MVSRPLPTPEVRRPVTPRQQEVHTAPAKATNRNPPPTVRPYRTRRAMAINQGIAPRRKTRSLPCSATDPTRVHYTARALKDFPDLREEIGPAFANPGWIRRATKTIPEISPQWKSRGRYLSDTLERETRPEGKSHRVVPEKVRQPAQTSRLRTGSHRMPFPDVPVAL